MVNVTHHRDYRWTWEEVFIGILCPFAPHICEEMWEHLGHDSFVYNESWPACDEKALVKDSVEVVVQINGKVKEKMEVPAGLSKDEFEKLALEKIRCIAGRVEEVADIRGRFDVVTSRAVANLRMLSELCLPLVKVGGYFLSMKAVDSEEEVNAAKNAIKTLGGQIEKVVDYAIPGRRFTQLFLTKEEGL